MMMVMYVCMYVCMIMMYVCWCMCDSVYGGDDDVWLGTMLYDAFDGDDDADAPQVTLTTPLPQLHQLRSAART